MKYAGPIKVIKTARGNRLSVTPNHPIMTSRGWKRADDLRAGDDVLGYRGDVEPMVICLGAVYDAKGPARIEDVIGSFSIHGSSVVTEENFHGDGRFGYGKVQVVRPDRILFIDGEGPDPQSGRKVVLISSDAPLLAKSLLASPFISSGCSSTTVPSGGALPLDGLPSIRSNPNPLDALSVGLAANLYTSCDEARKESASVDPSFVGKLFETGASSIAFDKVVEIRDDSFCGHVYDLQSEFGWIIAGNMVCGNCCCVTLPELGKSAPVGGVRDAVSE